MSNVNNNNDADNNSNNQKNICINVDSLSENHRQMYDLINHVILKGLELRKNNDICNKDLINLIFNDTIKRYKINSKKRNRRVIDKECMCMGRKLDTLQCTRRRLPGHDYCLSHVKNRPNGRIDEDIVIKKSKGKRGRKRKNNYDPKQNDKNYSTLWENVIDNEKYLIDINNNIFTFDLEKPKYLGRKNLEGKIEKLPPNIPK